MKKGCYVLLIKLNEDKPIKIGKSQFFFKKGFYIYVGSALNGLEHRIQRHLRENKNMYWHIDYLLQYGKIINVFYKESIFREECFITNKFADILISVPGFGSSDCKCNSHLFFGSQSEITRIIHKMNFRTFII
jgi:Uri superfamily endonuclease